MNMEAPEHLACAKCGSEENLARCQDCFWAPVWCKKCCVEVHFHLPFHRIEVWTGKHFRSSSLTEIGYVLYLGHSGKPCPSYSLPYQSSAFPTPSSIVVVDSNGIFTLKVYWCLCEGDTAHHIQLLRSYLYPGSTINPSTASTFDVMDHFYMDALECKTSAMSFYSKLRRFTNNTFPNRVPVRTSQKLRYLYLLF